MDSNRKGKFFLSIFDLYKTSIQSFLSSKFYLSSKTFSNFRSAGDVLQDIGSMLSDLTDELDAMLKLEKDD